jgi:hypothetical protein
MFQRMRKRTMASLLESKERGSVPIPNGGAAESHQRGRQWENSAASVPEVFSCWLDNGSLFSRLGSVWACRDELRIEWLGAEEKQLLKTRWLDAAKRECPC